MFITISIEDENGEPLFKFPLVEKDFVKAWNRLPIFVANEIHSKVLEMNPTWGGEAGEDEG